MASPTRQLAILVLLAALVAGGQAAVSAPDAKEPAKEAPADDEILPPKAVFEVSPQHPPAMLARAIEGEATVVVTVDVLGAAVNPVVEWASNDEFGIAAMVAASEWTFEPATRNRIPIELKVRIPFQFKISFEHRLNVELGREVYRELKAPVLRSSELAEAPLPSYIPALVDFYPEAFRGSGKSASVSLHFVIDPTGLVTNPRIIASSNKDFEEAALRAVSHIRYNPVVVDRQPAHVSMMMPLQLSE